jgi:transposase
LLIWPALLPSRHHRDANRHRLNRGGDRGANKALHTVAVVRLKYDERTRAYARRRTAEGFSMKDIMRCLKRAIAREMYQELTRPTGFTTAGEPTPESGPSGVDNL